jgi:hypothetical protein
MPLTNRQYLEECAELVEQIRAAGYDCRFEETKDMQGQKVAFSVGDAPVIVLSPSQMVFWLKGWWSAKNEEEKPTMTGSVGMVVPKGVAKRQRR